MKNKCLLLVFVLLFMQQYQLHAQEIFSQVAMPTKEAFETIIDGKQAGLYILKNKNKVQAAISNHGARVVALFVPDKNQQFTDVVLGFDSVSSYQKKMNQTVGATVGRYANRIGNAKFTLDGKDYQLDMNNGRNSIHGGNNGIAGKVWDVETTSAQQVVLSCTSIDGEGGFPGNVKFTVAYTLTENNSLRIDYTAATDKNTVINLTNHSYFNLDGAGDSSIADHVVTIAANRFTPVDSFSIPTGKIQNVAGTPLDFRKPALVGERIDAPMLKAARGYDHNYVLGQEKKMRLAAIVYSPSSGIVMEVLTNEPGVQFYTGNNLRGKEQAGKGGKPYGPRSGLCLETQHFPDSPNNPRFPSTVVKAGKTYQSSTIYRFKTRGK